MINVVSIKVRPPDSLPEGVRNHGYVYTSDWVNRLKNMVARYLPLEHAFACITDDPEGLDDGIVPIEAPGLPGWWNKTKAFDPGLPFADRVMVIDLDTVIVGDLTDLVNFPAPFVTAKQWKDITSLKTVPLYQGSVYVFDKGARDDVWTSLRPKHIEQFRSDGDWIAHLHPDEATFPPEWIVPLRGNESGPPGGAKVVLAMEVGGKNDVAAQKFDWVREAWH